MRFIRGESLKEAIGQFHGPPRPLAGRRRDPGVPQAPEPVRRRLPRDRLRAQPGGTPPRHQARNIMLGPHGETLVVDWGLAKALIGRTRPATPHAKGHCSAHVGERTRPRCPAR